MADHRQFHDLPVELLADIFGHISKPSQLATICLVDRTFHAFAAPYLYQRAFIYAWHKEGKANTLAECPHLARYVQLLEIRDFPRSIAYEEKDSLTALCIRGIRNCVNLQTCTWTRDGSISTDVLDTLSALPRLDDLTINGHSGTYYDPTRLLRFTRMRKISFIMPSSDVVAVLAPWVAIVSDTLRSLTLICKASPLITDELLVRLAPQLTALEELHLAGCPKVTHSGVAAIITANARGIASLGLEGLSATFNLEMLHVYCEKTDALARLASITLSLPPASTAHPAVSFSTNPARTMHPRYTTATSKKAHDDASWCAPVLALLAGAPLRSFHLYASGAGDRVLPDAFVRAFVDAHAPRLRRFSVHRIGLGLPSVAYICARCEGLEELFVVVERAAFRDLGPALGLSRTLCRVHVNMPQREDAEPDSGSEDEEWVDEDADEGRAPMHGFYVPPDEILDVVRAAGGSIDQFGVNTRVWQVARVPFTTADGEVEVETSLRPYERPDIPEQFLVVRT